MSNLLRKPFGTRMARYTRSRRKAAGWRYVGFSLYRLQAGDTAA